LEIDNETRRCLGCGTKLAIGTESFSLSPPLPLQIFNLIKTPVQLITAITQPATALCLARPVMLLLLFFSAGLASMQPCAATPFEWEYTGSLKTARFHHTATLLPDGRVLVAGGQDRSDSLASAELYDPATATWSDTGSLNTPRDSHTATLLPNGMVLVAGGENDRLHALASADLYDSATGTWSATGSLNTARYDHTATLLPNGMVLVAGGNPGELDSAELYDPATGTWSLTGSLNDGRADHVETLLPNGMVLVADGTPFPLASAELYDPTTGIWSLTGSLNAPRKDHAATLLPNGMVLVTAGARGYGKAPLASAELYDPGIVVSGRGSIDGQGDEATFEFHAKVSDDGPTGSLSFSDPAPGISITNSEVRTLIFNGNSAELGGIAHLGKGTRVTYSVTVTDNSSDGSMDTFFITLSNGYSAGGTLITGDIRIH
jgi:galactose oxidase-like protein